MAKTKVLWTAEDVRAMSPDQIHALIDVMERRLANVVEGSHPLVAGGALSAIVAQWIAGHEPSRQSDVLERWVALVLELAKGYSDAAWKGQGKPN